MKSSLRDIDTESTDLIMRQDKVIKKIFTRTKVLIEMTREKWTIVIFQNEIRKCVDKRAF